MTVKEAFLQKFKETLLKAGYEHRQPFDGLHLFVLDKLEVSYWDGKAELTVRLLGNLTICYTQVKWLFEGKLLRIPNDPFPEGMRIEMAGTGLPLVGDPVSHDEQHLQDLVKVIVVEMRKHMP